MTDSGPRSTSLPPISDGDPWLQAVNLAELGVLTASLLHELRQPLFAIKAHAQLGRAETGAEHAPVPRYDRILDQVAHVEDLLRYYSTFGRSDEPEMVFDLNRPVRSAIEMLAWRSRRGNVDLSLDLCMDELPIRGRELAARQVAINLLQNAVDAVDGQGGQDGRRVAIRTSRGESGSGRVARLVVEDSGPGIPEDLRSRVFEPFVTTKPRGTGLGLYIVRRLVDEARGGLRVVSPEAGGTRFEVDLPLVG